jgi:chlorite dismutase
MQRPAHTSSTEAIPPTLVPAGGGWHCSHLYYSFDRRALGQLTSDARAAGSRDLVAALDPVGPDAPLRLQTTITSGLKADFGVMLLDTDPLKIDRVHQRLMAGGLGQAIVPRWSFVSITEISEYVQSPEQFGERLVAEGMDADGAEFKTRL